MLCGISGEAPLVPVASKKSGAVFEKRLIEAYINENGKDPVTGEALTADDLVELKTSRVVRPRPPTLTSIPSLLAVFQNEWDALALETYTLRQQLAQTRQELSTALYQHDAAVRVIARLTRERDEARDALSKLSVAAGGAAPANGDRMQVDGQALPEALAAKVQETQAKLSKTRRKRPVPDGWASPEMIEKFKPAYTSIALHPGGSSLAVDESGDLVLLGGADGSAGVHSISQNKVVHTLEGAKGQVTDTLWWGSRAVISTASGQVLVFEEGRQTVAFTSHAGRVAALALHPTGEILASVGADKSFVFYDLTTHRQISQMFDESGLTTAAFHPDGHLFAAGTSTGQIQFYNVLSGAHSGSIDVAGPVQSFSFSENGIWLAVACAGQTSVAIWNLRTMALLKELEMGSPVDSVRWDYIGQFLAAAGPSGVTVRWYSKESKEWSEPLQSAVPSVALEWGPQAHSLVCLGGGGTITVLRETK